jgi:uncharacterized protein with PIN domain
MKFIADVMLGSLAKRMRLLGFDVLYGHALADNDLLRIALERGRIILTRDTALAARPLARGSLLIAGDRVDDQLRQVIGHFSLSPDDALTRCSVCNEPLEEMSRDAARDSVPEYVYQRMERFHHCRKCDRTYWRGSHVRNMGLRREMH